MTLNDITVDILNKVTIADFEELMKQDFDTNEGLTYFLEFCHRVVEGGIIQFFCQPKIFAEVIKKVNAELQTQSQFIGEAVQFAELHRSEVFNYMAKDHRPAGPGG